MYKLRVVVTAGWLLWGFATEPQRADPPFRVAAVETVKLVERGPMAS